MQGQSKIPVSFLDLFEKGSYGHLATLMPDGKPQVTPVWVDFDGLYLLINTAKDRIKDLNMRARPYIAISILDPEKPQRYLGIQGKVVEIVEDVAAEQHMKKLGKRYIDEAAYPEFLRRLSKSAEKRVLYRILPQRVHTFDLTIPRAT
ncbi:MAG: PPOX class F420-dependent oxidoreductase [Acidobacteria bacterium]|nr:PPOX class F420-dependent oxidoreductase [Acidobacteriota bacterium]